MTAPRLVIVMGVSGAGKSTVGAALAQRAGMTFVEGDALHPQSNIDKMQAGIALDDEDRKPWLNAIGERLELARGRGESLVVTCSALKKTYRDLLRSYAHGKLDFALLKAAQTSIADRLHQRKDHFMPASLLASQFVSLEGPTAGERLPTFDAMKPVAELVDEILRALNEG